MDPTVTVETAVAQTGSLSSEGTYIGTISAEGTASVVALVSGTVEELYVEVGDTVSAGAPLCRIDDESARLTLESALAGLQTAQAAVQSAQESYAGALAGYGADEDGTLTLLEEQVRLAEDNYADTQALFDIGAASQLEVDQAQVNYDTAVATRNSTLAQLEAGIQNAKSGLDQLDTALEHVDGSGNVIAPLSGTLATMNAVEGSYISNSLPLAVVNGGGTMRVTASVSETLVSQLAIGDPAEVTVSAIGQTFTAVICSVERAANAQTKLYTVTLTVPEAVEGLLPGMFADVVFRTDVSENTIVVPSDAILTSEDTQYVFVAEDGTARYTEITTGLTGTGVTEVLTGLTEGQQLVVVGQQYLSDGDPVRIVDGTDAAPEEETSAEESPEEVPTEESAPDETPDGGETGAP